MTAQPLFEATGQSGTGLDVPRPHVILAPLWQDQKSNAQASNVPHVARHSKHEPADGDATAHEPAITSRRNSDTSASATPSPAKRAGKRSTPHPNVALPASVGPFAAIVRLPARPPRPAETHYEASGRASTGPIGLKRTSNATGDTCIGSSPKKSSDDHFNPAKPFTTLTAIVATTTQPTSSFLQAKQSIAVNMVLDGNQIEAGVMLAGKVGAA